MPKNTELKELVAARGQLKARVTRFTTYLNATAAQPDIINMETRLQIFRNVLQEFEVIQQKIENITGGIQDEERSTFEDAFYSALAEANRRIINAYPPTQTTTGNPTHKNTNVKLPQVNLPEFFGLYSQWLTFYNTFESLIHNNSDLSKIEKFHYLKSCLKGDAAQVICSMNITEDNYDEALKMLKHRYENKKLIIHAHIKSIFEIFTVKAENHYNLRKLIDNFNRNIKALKTLGEPVQHWDTLLIYILTNKLDINTKRLFEENTGDITSPKFKDLTDFIEKRCQVLETIDNRTRTTKQVNYQREEKTLISHVATTQSVKCAFCKQAHRNYECPTVEKMTTTELAGAIKTHKLCTNCLRPGHFQRDCRTAGCKHCNKRHHHLLHTYEAKSEVKPETEANKTQTPEQTVTALHTTTKPSRNHVILATTKIVVYDSDGHKIIGRALLDGGSMANFMTENFAKTVRAELTKIDVPIAGITGTRMHVSNKVDVDIESTDGNYTRAKEPFLIVNKITQNVPQLAIDVKSLRLPEGIRLADNNFDQPGHIDLLLGADIFYETLCEGQVKLGVEKPILQNTKFGWLISGPAPILRKPTPVQCNLVTNEMLNEQLQEFWKQEEFEIRDKFWTKEEQECERHYTKNTTCGQDGRYIVRLPFKERLNELGDSQETATSRFYGLERRLNKEPKLREEYSEFMREYEKLKHMTMIDATKLGSNSKYYLPHHCVIKEHSTTTKLRVVFDASAKTTTNVSLNDVLKVGPKLQSELFDIIVRFRKHDVILTADVEKMFRQINIHEDDRKYQLIVWREGTDEELRTYELNTVTYGTAPAAFLAVRSLQQAAVEMQDTYKRASRTIMQDFYMDDLVTGGRTVEDVKKTKEEIVEILQRRGFNLRKWGSNVEELRTDKQQEMTEIVSKQNGKTLGIMWDMKNDELIYTLAIDQEVRASTKRNILSHIAKTFDPLGLLAPLTIRAKMLLQTLWQAQLKWDEPIPSEIALTWQQLQTERTKIKQINIPRQVTAKHTVEYELHGFSDASEKAYGACVYLRTTDTEGRKITNLLCAKSRVAPLRSTSLPRLELCAALLLTRLIKHVQEALQENLSKRYLWCDSTITLAWIAAEPSRWQTYVANRVAEIQQNTEKEEWRHVPSAQNPADLITRGISPEQILSARLWWQGPEFLERNEEEWPQIGISEQEEQIPEERKSSKLTLMTYVEDTLIEKYSSLNKLLRVMAYVMRFIFNAKPENKTKMKGIITIGELHRAQKMIVTKVQRTEFGEEIRALKNGRRLPRSSKLLQLNPFLDEEEILRVGGRIKNAEIEYDRKHQILLPSKHHLTNLIIEHEHERHLHAGVQATLASIRDRYWLLNGKDTVRKVLRKCIKCFKANPTNLTAQMGDLPASRLTPTRPFVEVGVDFAGPITIKDGTTRTKRLIKGYICLFVCFSTKAVHLELASELTTECFLNTLKRFIARRGLCKVVHSDNGTNFVGAANELERIFKFLKENIERGEIRNFLLENEITWKFIPPRTPHFGGLWEAGVKSAKYHIVRIMGNTNYTYQQFNTLLCQIEAVLNSRPLIPLSSDPNDLSALTPGHFLVGTALTALPDAENYDNVPVNRLKAFQHMQAIIQHFWKRWSREYLTALQQRSKWKDKTKVQLKEGDLVLVKEDNLPPLMWKMGRVTATHPGDDGVVRVVTLKTRSGLIKRNITKICALPDNDL